MFSFSISLKYSTQRAMNLAPTSLKAKVGPWNNSSEYISLSNFTNGKSKHSVSSIMFLSFLLGIQLPINCCIASKAIS